MDVKWLSGLPLQSKTQVFQQHVSICVGVSMWTFEQIKTVLYKIGPNRLDRPKNKVFIFAASQTMELTD